MDDLTTGWLADLERRHLADLTSSEVARALRALSSCYVERRAKLAAGEALGSRGKRAAFALFYGPLHFLVTREIVRALPDAQSVTSIVDIGCGTGAAGIAWAAAAGAPRVLGFDRSAWAVDEAMLAYRAFRLDGRAVRRDFAVRPGRADKPIRGAAGTGILAAYTVNELDDDSRASLLRQLQSSRSEGSRGARDRAHRPADVTLVGRMGGGVRPVRRPVRRVAVCREPAANPAAAGPGLRPGSARTDSQIAVCVGPCPSKP